MRACTTMRFAEVKRSAPKAFTPNSVSTTLSMRRVSPGCTVIVCDAGEGLVWLRSRRYATTVAGAPPGLWIQTEVYQSDPAAPGPRPAAPTNTSVPEKAAKRGRANANTNRETSSRRMGNLLASWICALYAQKRPPVDAPCHVML